MKKTLLLVLALCLVVMGVFAGVSTAEEEAVFVGYLEDAAMHSLLLHMEDGSEVNVSMNLGDEAVSIVPEEAGLALGERLAVAAVKDADGAYEATKITVLTCLAGVVSEYGKNGFTIDDGGVAHTFIVDDSTVTFPENGFLPGDVVEAAYDDSAEETLYQVFLANTLQGKVVSYEDDTLTLTLEDQTEVTFNATGAYEFAVLEADPVGKDVTVTFFGNPDTRYDTLPVHVYSVVAADK